VGLWTVTATTSPDGVESTLEAIRADLRAVGSAPLSDDELTAARAYIRGSVRLAAESSISQANRLADGTVLGDYQSPETFLNRIGAVSAVEVQAAASRYLDPDALTVDVLRPS
jgi:zinc protease